APAEGARTLARPGRPTRDPTLRERREPQRAAPTQRLSRPPHPGPDAQRASGTPTGGPLPVRATMSAAVHQPASLSPAGRTTVLVVAFLGWFGAGVHMAITQQTGRAASIDLLGRTGKIDAERFAALSKDANPSADDREQLKEWEVSAGR